MKVSEVYTMPPSCERSEIELKTYALLDRLGIAYEWVEHTPAATMEDCEDIGKVLGVEICKNLFLCNRQKTEFYLLSMPARKPFVTKELSHQIGTSRLSFAPGEIMEELIGCSPGSASVLGLAYDTEHRVRYLMDRKIYESDLFGCHACKNESSMKLKTDDIKRIFLPYTKHDITVVEL